MVNVLVVEDEYFIADEIARALKSSGVGVVGPVPTVREALDVFQSGAALDGVVLDINLRDEMVYPLASALRREGVPFIFASGCDPVVVPSEFEEVPLWGKPFEAIALARALRELAVHHSLDPTRSEKGPARSA